MYKLLQPLIFQLSAEKAHHTTTSLFGTICKIPILGSILTAAFSYEHPSLEREVFGLQFKNPVGLAAGFDKDGKYMTAMSKLGFGFLELGTVTPLPQGGNPKPRLFRLIKDGAVINRMGFNNEGVDFLVEKLKNYKKGDLIIGGNIGKNKVTPNEDAFKDYLICFQKLYDYVDYFVVNLSSPNTPGLRELQDKKPLRKILSTLLDYREGQNIKRPILLKIAPDLTEGQIKDVVEITQELKIEGLITTNTTIARSPLTTDKSTVDEIGNGGLSGAPLYEKSTEVLQQVYDLSAGKIPLIGVGGIHDEKTARGKLNAGASLIQVYSGMIYEGPWLIKRIKRSLVRA